MRRIMLALLLVLATLPLPLSVVGQTPAGFLDTFDGNPPAPLSFTGSARWDVMAHKRDENSSSYGPQGGMDGTAAHHGSNCNPYPATHQISALRDGTYFCRDHLMTAVNGGDYAAIVLTPNHQIDFSAGEAVIRFDISTLRISQRDWWDVWITPWDQVVPMPLRDPFLPDGYGTPRDGVVIDIGDQNTIGSAIVRNGGSLERHDGRWYDGGYDQFLSQSAERRDTVEIRISRTHIKIGMPAYNFYWVDENISALSFTRGVVQFGHHSYTPLKAGSGPNTWHWDNISISPSVPFSILQTNENPGRYIVDGTVLTFNQPAPANAVARFHVKGRNPSVSFNGGATWVNGTLLADGSRELKAVKVNVPVGATTMRIRATPNQWASSWWARNVSVMALDGGGPPPPTATPTQGVQPSATSTSTAVTPTAPPATPSPSATVTTTPGPTSTPTSGPPATATATATSAPPSSTATPSPSPPAPSATPAPLTFTSGATSAASVVRGNPYPVAVSVTSSAATTNRIVDVEIYQGATRVFQQAFTGQTFAAGVARTFNVSWAIPANAPTGSHVVKVGIFGPNWAPLHSWNNAARTFTVTTAPEATWTPLPAPSSTPSAPTSTPSSTTTPASSPSVPPTVQSTSSPPSPARFTTLPPGATLPSGAECAARVRPAAENRPGNTTANHRTGHQMSSMAGFNAEGNARFGTRVDGQFTGTTDEIIQWAACKWGFDEDIARAVAVTESYWNQDNVGDNGESFGLMQVRQPYHPDTYPDSQLSTAFNADYTLGSRRGCFEGYEPWLTTTTGDEWGCVGSWFSGRWHDAPAEQYISVVRGHYNNRTWAQPGF